MAKAVPALVYAWLVDHDHNDAAKCLRASLGRKGGELLSAAAEVGADLTAIVKAHGGGGRAPPAAAAAAAPPKAAAAAAPKAPAAGKRARAASDSSDSSSDSSSDDSSAAPPPAAAKKAAAAPAAAPAAAAAPPAKAAAAAAAPSKRARAASVSSSSSDSSSDSSSSASSSSSDESLPPPPPPPPAARPASGGKGAPRSNVPFHRVDESAATAMVAAQAKELADNTYEGTFGASGWGAKANDVLGKVKGDRFRHEKTKKKRGSYRGGTITGEERNSFVFDD